MTFLSECIIHDNFNTVYYSFYDIMKQEGITDSGNFHVYNIHVIIYKL